MRVRNVMSERTNWISLPGVLSLLLVVSVGASAVLATVLLEAFAIRLEGGGSLNTMFPGYVYANALIMKVTIVEAVILATLAMVNRLAIGNLSDKQSASFSKLAVVALVLPALAPIVGAIAILIAQSFGEVSINSFAYFSRSGVFSMMIVLVASSLVSVASIVRRDRPIAGAVLALAMSIVCLAIFRYWEFYKIGFDQDRWNNI